MHLWGPEDRERDCWTVSVVVGVSHTRGGSSHKDRMRRDKISLGAPGGKDWLRRENHEG